MNVLITGGSGFIGIALVVHLIDAGHSITVLSRSPDRVRARLPHTCRVVGSLADCHAVDVVINLAGESIASGRWTVTRKSVLRNSRIDGTRALVAWMRGLQVPPQMLISGSAIGYYGATAHDDELLTEDSPPGIDFPARLCRDWEHEALEAKSLGIKVCRLRTGIVLGPNGGALAKMLPPFRLGLGGPTGTGRQWMSWIHRADLCGLIAWLLQNPHSTGAWNATAPQPVINADFTAALARALQRPALVRTPALALKLAFGEMSELLLLGQRVIPARAHRAGFKFRFPEVNAAIADVLKAERG